MVLQISNVLSSAEVAAIRGAIADEALWVDGANTAHGRARAAKANEQACPEAPAIRGVLAKIRSSVLENRTLVAAAQPAALARVMLNRYARGMRYGAHVDAPYIDGVRTDLSFTLFLSDPTEYEGGELVIDSPGAEDAIKLAAGSLILYPSNSLHRVEEVTDGVRIAAIGWIRSRVRQAEHRSILFELESAIADLDALRAPDALCSRLANVRNNLLRAFGD